MVAIPQAGLRAFRLSLEDFLHLLQSELQSLKRAYEPSDSVKLPMWVLRWAVAIPQAGLRAFRRQEDGRVTLCMSTLQSLKRAYEPSDWDRRLCHTTKSRVAIPQAGLRAFRHIFLRLPCVPTDMLQSLKRAYEPSDNLSDTPGVVRLIVAIPQAGLRAFRPRSALQCTHPDLRCNPSSGLTSLPTAHIYSSTAGGKKPEFARGVTLLVIFGGLRSCSKCIKHSSCPFSGWSRGLREAMLRVSITPTSRERLTTRQQKAYPLSEVRHRLFLPCPGNWHRSGRSVHCPGYPLPALPALL